MSAYEMRISDCSSDVCSSDLAAKASGGRVGVAVALKLAGLPLLTAGFCWLLDVDGLAWTVAMLLNALPTATSAYIMARQIAELGRSSRRERVGMYVEDSVVSEALNNNTRTMITTVCN